MTPEIVVLCGSTRFKKEYAEANFRLTMQGKIVLSVGWFSHADGAIYTPTPAEKDMLDELHLRKIDVAACVFVINARRRRCVRCGRWDDDDVGCRLTCSGAGWEQVPYVGASTRREIAYALALGKHVEYLEPPTKEDG